MIHLSEVVQNLEGELVSDGTFQSIAFATESGQKNFLTFLENKKFLSSLENENISCILVTKELVDSVPSHIVGVFVCERPKLALFTVHNAMADRENYVGQSHPTVIGDNCTISPLSVIAEQNVVIGDWVTIEPFVTIKGRVTIGNNVTIRSGTVIGGKGFSFAKDSRGSNVSVVDTARIEIQDSVELFEQVAVSTGIFPWEKTLIRRNTKVDRGCFVAHGSDIGENCLLAAMATVCGNCRIGDNVWLGAGAVVSNRVVLGNNARVSIGSIVTKNVPEGQTVTGNFAIDHNKFIENLKLSIQESE